MSENITKISTNNSILTYEWLTVSYFDDALKIFIINLKNMKYFAKHFTGVDITVVIVVETIFSKDLLMKYIIPGYI